MPLIDDFAYNLRARRLELGITQKLLARASGVNESTIKCIEGEKNRKRGTNLTTIQLLADALYIDPVELLRPRDARKEQNPSSSGIEHRGTDSQDNL